MRRDDYGNREIDGVMCVWLQDYGWQHAKLGRDLMVGDVLMYNFGHTASLVSIDRETPKSIFVTVQSHSTFDPGKIYTNIKIGKETYKPVE